jgi:hypothetical protein
LILPIHEHGKSFHLLVSSSISSSEVFIVEVFELLIKYTPRYLMFLFLRLP